MTWLLHPVCSKIIVSEISFSTMHKRSQSWYTISLSASVCLHPRLNGSLNSIVSQAMWIYIAYFLLDLCGVHISPVTNRLSLRVV